MSGRLILKWNDACPNTGSINFKLLDLFDLRHTLIRHKKKTGGGFSKILKMDDGTEINVNTNVRDFGHI